MQAIFDKDETAAYARSLLAEIEAGQKDCRFGEYGRAYQFVDSGFFPNETSLGDCFAAASVLGWRCAPGINSATELVRGHPDPEEVEDGHFKVLYVCIVLYCVAGTCFARPRRMLRAGECGCVACVHYADACRVWFLRVSFLCQPLRVDVRRTVGSRPR